MDIINFLSGTDFAERNSRVQAKENAQLSFEVLLEGELSERYAVAAFVAGLHQSSAAGFYLDLLEDEDAELVAPVTSAIELGLDTGGSGPVGGASASWLQLGASDIAEQLGERLVAALDFAHYLTFHPGDAAPEHLVPVARIFTADETVTLAQLVSFLAFQLRLVHGLAVLGGQGLVRSSTPAGASSSGATAAPKPTGMPLTGGIYDVLDYPNLVEPTAFVRHSLGWKPWVPAPAASELTVQQVDSMIRPDRIGSAYFRLLARDPGALRARTLTDLDIFYNTESGIGRAERELAATVASRYNGCIYCASIHSARTLEESEGRLADVERLLAEGVIADLGSEEWNVIRDATVALTDTPVAFGPEHVQALRGLGFDTASIIDVMSAGAFFNWANRLMLTLGAVELPKRFRTE